MSNSKCLNCTVPSCCNAMEGFQKMLMMLTNISAPLSINQMIRYNLLASLWDFFFFLAVLNKLCSDSMDLTTGIFFFRVLSRIKNTQDKSLDEALTPVNLSVTYMLNWHSRFWVNSWTNRNVFDNKSVGKYLANPKTAFWG